MGVRAVWGRIVQLVFGGLLGCLLGGLLTGIEGYWIALAIGFPLLLTFGGVFGSIGARQAKAAGAPLRQGIISTIPGMQVRPVQTGTVLNGVPVSSASEPGAVRRSPALWRLLSILTIVVGAVLVLLPAHQVLGWVASDVVAGRPFDGRDMRTGLHQQEAFDSIVDVIGGTEVTRISFFDRRILVSAPSAPGARTVDQYEWADGRATRSGPDFSQPDDLEAALFDAADIDLGIVADLVRESIADAGLEGLDGIYPSISRWSGEEPRISVALTGAYFEAYYEYSVTGELIQRGGSAFD